MVVFALDTTLSTLCGVSTVSADVAPEIVSERPGYDHKITDVSAVALRDVSLASFATIRCTSEMAGSILVTIEWPMLMVSAEGTCVMCRVWLTSTSIRAFVSIGSCRRTLSFSCVFEIERDVRFGNARFAVRRSVQSLRTSVFKFGTKCT